MKISRSGNGFDQEPDMLQTAFWKLQRPDIRSKPKNDSRAMKISCAGNDFDQEPEMFQNGFLEPSKTRYSVQTEKWLARNENEMSWQWFWAKS